MVEKRVTIKLCGGRNEECIPVGDNRKAVPASSPGLPLFGYPGFEKRNDRSTPTGLRQLKESQTCPNPSRLFTSIWFSPRRIVNLFCATYKCEQDCMPN